MTPEARAVRVIAEGGCRAHPQDLARAIAAEIDAAVSAERERCTAVARKQLSFAEGDDYSPNCPHCADHVRAILRRIEGGSHIPETLR